MKNYIIQIEDGDDNKVAELCLKSNLTRDELQESIVMEKSKVFTLNSDTSERVDDCFTVGVEEIAE